MGGYHGPVYTIRHGVLNVFQLSSRSFKPVIMLSQTCKTALKTVIYLSLKSEQGEKAGIKEIAEQIIASGHIVWYLYR